MAERFTKLFELPGGFYATGAPVLIRAGALLRDNLSHGVLCQLKFYNLDTRTIRSMRVVLQLRDSLGRDLGKEIERSYLDLRAEHDTEFGQGTALILPGRQARSFTVRVTEVGFEDGTAWLNRTAEWYAVEKHRTLADAYGDAEMATQFQIRYGADCLFEPLAERELWYCTCGLVNRSGEPVCHGCRRVRKALLAVDAEELRQECERRLAEEAEEEAEKKAERRPRRKVAFWKFASVFVPALVLLLAVVLGVPRLLDRLVPLPVMTPPPPFEERAAVTQVTPEPTPPPLLPTPEPTLSPEEQMQAAYSAAVELLDGGSYSAARAAFLALDGYGDSAQLAEEAIYRKAVALYGFIEQQDERDVYAYLSMSAGEPNRISMSTQKALALGSSAVDSLRAACGSDPVDISFSEVPSDSLRPLAACVKDLFSLLGGYRDSAERLQALDALTDYTRDFYMLLEAGDIYGAYDWLAAFTGDFPNREQMLQMLTIYKPFCGSWTLDSGDYTLLPLTVGHEFPCNYFTTRVIIIGGTSVLRFQITEGESDFFVDLYTQTGTNAFACDTGYFYRAEINRAGHLAYLKFFNGALVSSCEYRPTW